MRDRRLAVARAQAGRLLRVSERHGLVRRPELDVGDLHVRFAGARRRAAPRAPRAAAPPPRLAGGGAMPNEREGRVGVGVDVGAGPRAPAGDFAVPRSTTARRVAMAPA